LQEQFAPKEAAGVISLHGITKANVDIRMILFDEKPSEPVVLKENLGKLLPKFSSLARKLHKRFGVVKFELHARIVGDLRVRLAPVL
jgi:hypothetical protein